MKKTITTKSVGLKKNGKGGERRTTCHSRNVGHQIKVGNKNKNDRAPTTETREGRSESPAPRDLTQKEGTKKSRKNRTTTIRASLPAAYRKERIEQKESNIEALTSDECIDLDELAKVEIDNEQGNGEYNQTNLSDMENAEKENAEKENAEMSTSKSSTNSNISALEPTQNRNIEFETKSCSNNQATFQYALESMDAAFYALGKFVGEKTCHDPSFGRFPQNVVFILL